MKHILYFFISLLFLFMYNSCLNDPDMNGGIVNGGIPLIEKLNVVEGKTTATSIELQAEITKENGVPVIECGFIYRVKDSTDSLSKKALYDKNSKIFSAKIEGLDDNKEYEVKAYAINKLNKQYYTKDTIITTKKGIGFVRAELPDSIRAISAILKASITTRGEGEITIRGFYLSKKEDMSDKDSIKIIYTQTDTTFTSIVSGLLSSTTYYVKAFVGNKYGMFDTYSKPKSFTTTDGKPILSTPKVINKLDKGVVIESNVLDGGDAHVFERGICWSESENPTIKNDTVISTNEGIGSYNVLVHSLTPKKVYYARAYAQNSYGIAYSKEQISFLPKSNLPVVKIYTPILNSENGTVLVKGEVIDQGASSVSVSGICWSINSMPTISNDTLCLSSGLSAFEGLVSKLRGGKEYYFRAFAINSSGVEYSDEIKILKTTPVFETMKPFTYGIRVENSSATFSIGESAYIVGGDKGSECTDLMYLYNSRTNEWSPYVAYPNGKMKWLEGIGVGNNAYVFGGSTGGNNPILTNKVYRYSANTNTWWEINTNSGPEPFHSTRVAYVLDYIYLIGGFRDNATNEVWSFSLSGKWEKKNNFPIKQYAGIALTIRNRIYAGLGYVNTNEDTTNRIWTSSGDMNTWTEETTMPGGGKAKGGVVFNDMIYVVDDRGVIREYNPLTKEWKSKSILNPRNRKINCIYSINNAIYIGLGDNSSELIKYNPLWDNE